MDGWVTNLTSGSRSMNIIAWPYVPMYMYWLGAQFREAACEVVSCANMILAGKGKMPTLPTHPQPARTFSQLRAPGEVWMGGRARHCLVLATGHRYETHRYPSCRIPAGARDEVGQSTKNFATCFFGLGNASNYLLKEKECSRVKYVEGLG